ncbi:alpha/beta hydrolase [Pontixanthobacter aestiaquae]|uniref:alpha/beta hydrolase n=1 Tax=Pontixanthobacter aestiaquae TaxID=1509367 RepID=UPI0019294222|nr:alpha/beta hydrolase [Pontixanthobacter aestiaquae]MDN3646551.1 alpha/beta hydrolase [Pontixanthobacter aestiaquae]
MSGQVLSVETYVEEWSEAEQKWVRVVEGADRFAAALPKRAAQSDAIAAYGPFRAIDQHNAELVGVTDRASPTDFAALLADFPGIKTLKLVEAPGTDDDLANMKLGRLIRAAGIETHVPHGGSVRSGAVELFLAGANRRIDDGAEFAVHSWIDAHGRQPQDFAMDAAPNRMYLDYYREMGMSADEAVKFYAMTNSVGYSDAKWLTAQDMRGWIGQEKAIPATLAGTTVKPGFVLAAATENRYQVKAEPKIAYLDLDALLP